MSEVLSKVKPKTNRGFFLTVLIVVFVVFSILIYYTIGLEIIFLIIFSVVAFIFLLIGFLISSSGKIPENDISKQIYKVQDELRKNKTLQLTDQITLLKQKMGQYQDIYAYEREIILDQQKVMEDILDKTEEAGINIQDIKLKMQQDIGAFENDWQQRRRELDITHESELKKLEENLKKEEERVEMLKKRREYEKTVIKLKEQYQTENYEKNINQIILNHELIFEILLKWQKISGEQNIQSTINSAISDIKSSIENLENQKSNIGNRFAVFESLRFINDQITSLKDTLSYQRASPVFTVINLKDTKLFFEVNDVQYLCECCFKPMDTITIKKIRKWVRWGLLGMRVFIKLPFIDDYLNSLSGQLGSVIPKQIPELGKQIIETVRDDEIDEKLKEEIKDCSESIDTLIESIGNIQKFEFLKDENVIADIREKMDESPISMGQRFRIGINYYQKNVKHGNFEEINNYLEIIEKTIWNNFSHSEQEEIRKRLRETGNARVFTKDLILKNGLYLCDECVKMVEFIDQKTL